MTTKKATARIRCAIYSRVSTDHETTENQERELLERAERAGWEVVKVYRDHGVSGAKSGKTAQHSRPWGRTPPSASST